MRIGLDGQFELDRHVIGKVVTVPDEVVRVCLQPALRGAVRFSITTVVVLL